jgi:hypothetical protein
MAVVMDMNEACDEELKSKIRYIESLNYWGYVVVTITAFVGLYSWKPFLRYSISNPVLSFIVSVISLGLVVLFTNRALISSRNKYIQSFSHPLPEEL